MAKNKRIVGMVLVRITEPLILHVGIIVCLPSNLRRRSLRWAIERIAPPVLDEAQNKIGHTRGCHERKGKHGGGDAQGVGGGLAGEKKLRTDDVSDRCAVISNKPEGSPG